MAKTVLFGRYRLDEPLGAGGSAQVWRATDKRTGDVVAVKRLHPLVFADQLGRERLLREFRALRDLDEPHVVRVRDLELTDDDGALILDYVAGPSLATRLSSGPRLSTAEAVSIALDVAAALGAAHAAGIVHRDVTPGNILLDPDDGARLTDFGIALGGAGTAGEPALTVTGQLVGTLRYLAPEQLRGAPATPASDVHALAAVTYEMLANRHAYRGGDPGRTRGGAGTRRRPDSIGPTRARRGGPTGAVTGSRQTGRPMRPRSRAEIRAALATDRTEPVAIGAAVADLTSSMPAPLPVPAPRPVAPVPVDGARRAALGPSSHGHRPRGALEARSSERLRVPLAAVLALVLAGLVLAALAPSAAPGAAITEPRADPGGTPVESAAPTAEPSQPPSEDGQRPGQRQGQGQGPQGRRLT